MWQLTAYWSCLKKAQPTEPSKGLDNKQMFLILSQHASWSKSWKCKHDNFYYDVNTILGYNYFKLVPCHFFDTFKVCYSRLAKSSSCRLYPSLPDDTAGTRGWHQGQRRLSSALLNALLDSALHIKANIKSGSTTPRNCRNYFLFYPILLKLFFKEILSQSYLGIIYGFFLQSTWNFLI